MNTKKSLQPKQGRFDACEKCRGTGKVSVKSEGGKVTRKACGECRGSGVDSTGGYHTK